MAIATTLGWTFQGPTNTMRDVTSPSRRDSCNCHLCNDRTRRLPKTVNEPKCLHSVGRALPSMCNTGVHSERTIEKQQSMFQKTLCPANDREAPLQWKVKRQSDGNRLSTQDPAQTRLLRKRGRIILEKHVAMTVDNKRDTELRTGRYRSRGQRKRHLVQEALQEEVLMRTATGEDRKNRDIVKADTGQLYPL